MDLCQNSYLRENHSGDHSVLPIHAWFKQATLKPVHWPAKYFDDGLECRTTLEILGGSRIYSTSVPIFQVRIIQFHLDALYRLPKNHYKLSISPETRA
jgi:hypothetical protein